MSRAAPASRGDRSGPPGASLTATSRPGSSSHMQDTLSHKSVVEKQRAAIEKLRQQNARLKEDLLLENKFSVRPSNPGASLMINKLQDEADIYTRKIQLERRKALMLQQQLEQLTAKLGDSRHAMGSIFSAKEKSVALQKQIKIMENRLEKQYIKYNEAVTYNKALREQVDNLRRERLMFEAIDGNLVKELARVKRGIADTITAANEAHASKEKAAAEASALKLTAEKEHAAFEEEWRQLTRLIEDDKHARDAARQNEMAERERQTQELLKSCEASAASKKKAARTSWCIGMHKANVQNMSHQKVRLFAEAFAKIQEATAIADIDDLVAAFAAAEDASFNLFSYVNEVNAEVEALEDSIAAARGNIEDATKQARADEACAGAAASSTHASRAEAEATAAAYEARLSCARVVVERLKRGVASLFDTAGCNTEAMRVLLGGEGLHDANMLAHLGIIEQRSNELLQAFALSQPEHPELLELLRAQPVLPTPGHRIVVEPPSTISEPPAAALLTVGGQLTSAAGAAGSGGGFSWGGGGAAAAAAAEQDEEVLPDDVPLTRAQLQAKVARNLDSILERCLKVKLLPAGGGGGGGAGRAAAAVTSPQAPQAPAVERPGNSAAPITGSWGPVIQGSKSVS